MFPESRPESYNPAYVWDEETESWVETAAAKAKSGGSLHSKLVVITENAIFVEDYS